MRHNGLFKINNLKELKTFFLDKRLNLINLFEEYINGRELRVGILENKIVE